MELKLIQVLSQITSISHACAEEIMNLCEKQELPKGHLLLPAGKVCRKLYFIDEGLIRFFYFDKEGKDVTYQFFEENLFTSVINSYYTQTPSLYNIETLEDTIVQSLNFYDFEQLLNRYPELDKTYHQVLRKFLMAAEHRILSLQFYSAEERYRDLLTRQPSIIQRVSLGHIASYLGINQATLSRVRSRVRL